MEKIVRLNPYFIRAGNNLLNIAHVVKIEPAGGSAVTVTMSNGEAINVSIEPLKVLDFMEAAGWLVKA